MKKAAHCAAFFVQPDRGIHYRRIQYCPVRNITSVQVRIANNVVHTASRARLENDQKRNGLVPQAGLVVVDFIEDGNLASLLDTEAAPTCELRLTTTAGELVKTYQEFIDPIGRL